MLIFPFLFLVPCLSLATRIRIPLPPRLVLNKTILLETGQMRRLARGSVGLDWWWRKMPRRRVPHSLIVEEWWKLNSMEIWLLASAAKVLTKVAGRSLQFASLWKSNLEASLKGTNSVSRGNGCLKELVETILDVCQCVGELNSPSWGYLVTCRCFHFKHDTKQSQKHRNTGSREEQHSFLSWHDPCFLTLKLWCF